MGKQIKIKLIKCKSKLKLKLNIALILPIIRMLRETHTTNITCWNTSLMKKKKKLFTIYLENKKQLCT